MNILPKLVSEKYFNQWFIFTMDVVLSVVSTLFPCLFIYFYVGEPFFVGNFHWIVLLSMFSSVFSFLLWKSYVGIIRHSTLKETWRLALAAVTKVLLLYLALSIWLWSRLSVWIVLCLLLDILSMITFMLTARVALIVIYDRMIIVLSDKQKRLFIYGASSRSLSLLTRLQQNSGYQAIGFVDPESGPGSFRLAGYPVFQMGDVAEFTRIVNHYKVEALLFPDYQTAREEKERLIDCCETLKLKVLVSPPLDEVDGDNLSYRKIREVRIEDLLGREEIEINMAEIQHGFQGKTVLVTGAAGSIGSELCRQLASLGVKSLILYDSAETPMHNLRLELSERFKELLFIPVIGDVRLEGRIDFVFRHYHPQVVFHAAAYKHVPLMEENPCEAVRVNVYGTYNLARKAVQYRVEKFVMVSTDKAVNPTNVMGASKRIAEIFVQSLSLAIKRGEVAGQTAFVTTRFGNVLGSNGSVIPRFREQIEAGGPVTVTHPDIIRYFMTIPEACRLVMEAATMGKGGEIFIFEMGEPVRIVDLANRMIRLAGFEPGKDIEISYTGLRPGEKLFEELLCNKEKTLPTPHRKIRVACVREYPYADIYQSVIKLSRYSEEVRIPETVRLMKEIVHEFKSRNSTYESIDRELEKEREELPVSV